MTERMKINYVKYMVKRCINKHGKNVFELKSLSMPKARKYETDYKNLINSLQDEIYILEI